jgi:hypothetical protein
MELESFFIAENAEVVSGRFFAFGGGIDHIKAARFPAVVPSLAVIVNILVAPGEAASVHRFRMSSIAPDGSPFLINITREFGPLPLIEECPDLPARQSFLAHVESPNIPVPGVYSLVVFVDEQELGRRQVLCSQDTTSPAMLTAADSRVARVEVRGEEFQDALDRIEAQKMLPSIDVLVKMARVRPPPQAWWDEDFTDL